jgi:hypothetical protein
MDFSVVYIWMHYFNGVTRISVGMYTYLSGVRLKFGEINMGCVDIE